MARRLHAGRLVIATHNTGKLAELADMLAPFGLDCVSAGDLDLPEPEETGTTFEENAILKARGAAVASGLPALADDSGLAVDALGGDPGIYSARWAGPDKDFAMAMRTVEEKLRAAGATGPADRRATFVAVIAVAWPDSHVETFRGECAGELVWPPRGDLGFGYDPMFKPDGYAISFGEMPAEKKHGIDWSSGLATGLSHRARAFVRFADACLGARAA